MAYKRPTVAELAHQQSVDLSAQLKIPQSQVARSNAGVIGNVQAGGLHGLYGYLGYLINQQFEDSADEEYFTRRANIRKIPKKTATKATGTRLITGVDSAEIPQGTLLQRTDGERFVVTVGTFVNGGKALVNVEAENTGIIANTSEDESLQFVTPLAGIESQTLTGAITGGTDDEELESHRARVVQVIQEPPHGGADRDYIIWAKACPNVNVGNVWVQSKWLGVGTVGVFFALTNNEIPTDEQVALVQSHINLLAPVTADVYVMAPNSAAVDIEITEFSPDTPTTRAAALAELNDLFLRSAVVENGTNNAKVLLSHIREALSIASGESDHRLLLPADNVTLNKGELPKLGEVTWT
jgi:uncharacterized phage protein gp47/JayE